MVGIDSNAGGMVGMDGNRDQNRSYDIMIGNEQPNLARRRRRQTIFCVQNTILQTFFEKKSQIFSKFHFIFSWEWWEREWWE